MFSLTLLFLSFVDLHAKAPFICRLPSIFVPLAVDLAKKPDGPRAVSQAGFADGAVGEGCQLVLPLLPYRWMWGLSGCRFIAQDFLGAGCLASVALSRPYLWIHQRSEGIKS